MKIKAQLLSDFKQSKCLALGIFEDQNGKLSSELFSNAERAEINKCLEARQFKGTKCELIIAQCPQNKWGQVIFVGLGKRKDFDLERARRAGSYVYKKTKSEKLNEVDVDWQTFSLKDDADYAQAFVEGFLLSAYTFNEFKSKKKDDKPQIEVGTLRLGVSKPKALKDVAEAVQVGETIADCVNFTRTLGNQPPNVLYPESYANRIEEMCKTSKIKCQVLDESKMKALKMGGILGVGLGSHRGPRLVVMEYKSSKAKNKKPVVLVGKGITFDTGGISIKPANKMEEMKFDMCGSAAVVGALRAVAALKLPVHVIGITPLAENMPGGGAQRPGDIITCHNGKTVEVLNTDAEGRLVLADALAYAEKFEPKYLVNIATLTGACAATLDFAASGVMGTDPGLIERLKKAGLRTGERLWEFPLWEEYDDFIKGTYADIQNISRRSAGIQTAGAFLKNFGGHSPWAHLDIAGTAWGAERIYNPTGATGMGVRLFVEFLRNI